VLIADDEEAFRYVMRRMIDVQQYEILEAADGDAAVMVAQSAHPDIIILDINLPKLDGYSVLDELARVGDTRDISVIVSTSLVLSDRDRARLAHSYAILSKAMLSRDLLSVMLSDALQKQGAS
jgi:CheY-like chemotaxis protein